jgi:hypothetical protein
MQLYVVGKMTETSWEFAGVFDDERMAVVACRDETYFVGPAILNKPAPAESVAWPGAYYPLVHATDELFYTVQYPLPVLGHEILTVGPLVEAEALEHAALHELPGLGGYFMIGEYVHGSRASFWGRCQQAGASAGFSGSSRR